MGQQKINRIVEIINSKSGKTEMKKQLDEILESCSIEDNWIVLSVEEVLLSLNLPFVYDEEIEINYIDKVKNEELKPIVEIWEKTTQNYFIAVMGEVLGNRLNEKKYSIRALEAYYEELNGNNELEDEMFVCLACSICRVYRKNKIPTFKIEEFENLCMKYIDSHKDEKNNLVLFLLKGLYGIKYKNINSLYFKLIDHFRSTKNYECAIALEEDFRKYVANSKEEKKDIYVMLAEDYERSADQYDWNDPKMAFLIISKIQNALNGWRKINDERARKERKRLVKRIEDVQKNQLKNMQTISVGKIDVKEIDKSFERFLQITSFEECIVQFINIVKLQNVKNIKKQLEKTIFTSFIPISILDKKGKTVAIAPSVFDDNIEKVQERCIYEAKKEYEIETEILVKRFLVKAKEKFQFTEETLSFILDSNIFVPKDRKKTFLKGIVAGFNCDFITAMHLLMPQVENSIRVLAEECGIVVNKINEDGVEESLSLDGILNLPEVKDVLEEDFIFNLKTFYTSKVGFGMRNRVAHGIYDDDELQGIGGVAVWWYTFKLCCQYSGGFRQRLLEIKK